MVFFRKQKSIDFEPHIFIKKILGPLVTSENQQF